jgi:hypothetical protein
MSSRFLLWCLLPVLGFASLRWAVAAAPSSPQTRYKGTYFMTVLSFQNLFQFGGVYRIDPAGMPVGSVIGTIYDGNDTIYHIPPGTTITNQGRFSVDLVNGANVTTLTLGQTAVGQTIGRQETPNQFYPLGGQKYNNFYLPAGLYVGNTTDLRNIIITVNLQRRITGVFEQTPGNYTQFYGSGTLAGINGRTALAITFFNSLFNPATGINNNTPVIANGTWRQSKPYLGNLTGNFYLQRVTP